MLPIARCNYISHVTLMAFTIFFHLFPQFRHYFDKTSQENQVKQNKMGQNSSQCTLDSTHQQKTAKQAKLYTTQVIF